jgi:hypothetical protein
MTNELGASACRPGSREPSPSVSAASGFDPSRVIDYINAASAEGVIAEYGTYYAEDGWANVETWDRFKRVMNDKIGVSRTDEMRVILRHLPVSEWNDAEGIDVGGADNEHSNWSLSFTPWGEWKLLAIEDATGKALTVDQIAAHLFYEICWYGWEDQAEQVRDDVRDAKEAVDRGLVGLTPLFSRDSDRSGEAGETGTGSTEGESAGRSDSEGIAQRTKP